MEVYPVFKWSRGLTWNVNKLSENFLPTQTVQGHFHQIYYFTTYTGRRYNNNTIYRKGQLVEWTVLSHSTSQPSSGWFPEKNISPRTRVKPTMPEIMFRQSAIKNILMKLDTTKASAPHIILSFFSKSMHGCWLLSSVDYLIWPIKRKHFLYAGRVLESSPYLRKGKYAVKQLSPNRIACRYI